MKTYVLLKNNERIFKCNQKEEAVKYVIMNDYSLGLVDEKLYCDEVWLYVK